MEKIRIREAILVEGRYDAHKLRQWIDGVVLEAGGFSLFSIPKKLKLIKDYAENQGLIILTDSDHAGLFIRNRLKGMLPSETVRHAYIPPTPGKEKRKPKPSAEGLLGVEGMPKEVVLAALRKAGATIEGETLQKQPSRRFERADLYEAGLFGRFDSKTRRARLLSALALPQGLSTNALLDALNRLFSPEEVKAAMAKLDEEERNSIG
ncbi:MAG TPA: DUF4093 domain-containing protein [Clostridiales bacterium]|jgi:ribonuclease M5|nr:DUF4093 domain-containing protein [Clostridiales bacterium]